MRATQEERNFDLLTQSGKEGDSQVAEIVREAKPSRYESHHPKKKICLLPPLKNLYIIRASLTATSKLNYFRNLLGLNLLA